MSKIWFVTDTHFGHSKVEKERGVDGLAFISKINEWVDPKDTLYHLGDFAWGGEKDWNRWRALIKCQRIRLVPGNHDHRVKRNKIDGIEWLDAIHIVDLGGPLPKAVLCHYPLEVWPQKHYGFWHLHGHCHSGAGLLPVERRWNLCPELTQYIPINPLHIPWLDFVGCT